MKVGLVTATVEDAEGVVELTRSKERALLCLVALTPGRIVSVDRLIDGLWGDNPPRTAAKTLQTYVKNLRSRIAATGAARDTLRTEPPGYVLVVDRDDVDVLRFERLADEAQRAATAGELTPASDLFTQALDIVTEQELLAFDSRELDPARVRVVERRRRAIDDLVDVQLRQGRHLDVIAPLTERLDREPQNERAWAQLMTALYRSDRQRDALQAFAVARDRLRDDFGLEPGPALVDLEQQILRHEVAGTVTRAPSQPSQQVAVTVTLATGTAVDAATAVDRVLEPGSAVDRFSHDGAHRVLVPDLAAAMRLATRLRLQRPDARVVAAPTNEPPPTATDEATVFAPSLGTTLAERGWTRSAPGWTPPDVSVTLRVPPILEQLRDRSPVHIRRGIEARFDPHLDAVQEGAIRTLQLSGAAGIGKTSQLANLAAMACARGQAVLYCRAENEQLASNGPIADLAYQALLLLDRTEVDHHIELHGSTLAALLPEMSRIGDATTRRGLVSSAETEAAVVDLLQRLARNLAVVLLIDDAPLLSVDATRVVRRLMNDARTTATLCVLSCRTDDPEAPPLAAELMELRSHEHTLHLAPFSTDETARFLEAAAGIDRSPRTRQVAKLVHQAARGLPLFVREIAHDMLASTHWLTADRKWRIDRTADEMALPQSLSELLGRRLSRLDPDAQDLASIGGVFGDFSALLVATVSELPVAEVLTALDQLIEQRVVEPIPGLVDHYRFSHPLLREAAISRIGPGRQSAVALAGAELMSAQQNPSDEQIDRRAELWFRALPLAAADQVEAELRNAAITARRRADHGRTLLHLRRIVQLCEGAGREPDIGVRVELAEAAVLAQTDVGLRRSLASQAFDAAHAIGEPQLSARAALAFAGPFNPFGSLVAVDGDSVLMAQRALDLAPADEATRARLLGMLAAARSDVAGASPEIEPALELGEGCDDQRVFGQLLSLAHALRSSAEPVDDRRRDDERILDIARTENDRSLELQGWGWSAAHAFEAGDIAHFDLASHHRAELAERLDDRIYQWSDLVTRGMRHTVAGRFDAAEASLWQALEVGRLPLADHANRFFGLQLLKLSEMRGQGKAMVDTTEAFARRLGYVTAFVSLAHLYAETGDVERAAQVVDAEVPPDLGTLPHTYDRLPTLALLARIAQHLGDADLAARVYRELRPSQGLLCVHADAVLYGSVHHNLGRCALATGEAAVALEHFEQSLPVYTELRADAWLCLLESDVCQGLNLAGDSASARTRRAAVDATAKEMGLRLPPA